MMYVGGGTDPYACRYMRLDIIRQKDLKIEEACSEDQMPKKKKQKHQNPRIPPSAAFTRASLLICPHSESSVLFVDQSFHPSCLVWSGLVWYGLVEGGIRSVYLLLAFYRG